jgi:hypothetical protein
MRAVALLRAGRDYGVAFLDFRIAGLRETGTKPVKYVEELEAIQGDLLAVMPKLKDMYVLDTVLEDTAGRRYVARLYTSGGVVYYVILASPKNTLRGVLKRLTQQGWRVLIHVERKTVKRSTTSETDAQ